MDKKLTKEQFVSMFTQTQNSKMAKRKRKSIKSTRRRKAFEFVNQIDVRLEY